MADVRRSLKGVLQKHRTGARSFGKVRRARFLDTLAATCNVRASAARAGVCPTTVYDLRRRDGAFAQLWAEAIDQGQERLREELIARALGQVQDEDNPDEVRGLAPAAAFDPELALRILKLQARTAPGGQRRSAPAAPPSKEEMYAILAQRLDEAEARAARRLAAEQPRLIEHAATGHAVIGDAATEDAATGHVAIGHKAIGDAASGR